MTLAQLLIFAKKVKDVADGVFAISALFVVPCIAVTPVLWLLQKPPEIRSHASARTLVEGGDLQELKGGLDFKDGAPLRVAYQLELVNAQGIVVRFPRVETQGALNFDSMLLPIPQSVKPGTYKLIAQVQYTVNPIKAVDKAVEVTTIVVN